MTMADEEILIAPVRSPNHVRIDCQTEERQFVNDPSRRIYTSGNPIRLTMNEHVKPSKYRSEIVVQNNPNLDLYVKRLRVAFQTHDDPRMNTRTSPRSRSLNIRREEKSRSTTSFPRSNSQALLHQWIDDICSNEKLMADEEICFFIKNGEFLARI